jgi:hypothetical protein
MTGGWGRPFDEPIEVAGRNLVTLRDAGEYIAALPKKEHAAPEWQAAMQALIMVAGSGGPTMLARIGVVRALNDTTSQSSTRRAKSRIGADAS